VWKDVRNSLSACRRTKYDFAVSEVRGLSHLFTRLTYNSHDTGFGKAEVEGCDEFSKNRPRKAEDCIANGFLDSPRGPRSASLVESSESRVGNDRASRCHDPKPIQSTEIQNGFAKRWRP